MKALRKLLFLGMVPLLLSACSQDVLTNPPSKNLDGSSPAILSIEKAEAKIPFKIKQPSIPFKVTETSARILDTNGKFDAVEITYANPDEGLSLILMTTNSTADTAPTGKKGLKLANGSQTWDQGNEHLTVVYWRNEGLTYSLIAGKNNHLEPLYDYESLIEIANTIQ